MKHLYKNFAIVLILCLFISLLPQTMISTKAESSQDLFNYSKNEAYTVPTDIDSETISNSDLEEITYPIAEKFNNITVNLTKKGLLTISGTGDYFEVSSDEQTSTDNYFASDYFHFINTYSKDITSIKVDDLTNITSTMGMFYNLYNVNEIDLSGLNTSKVTDMTAMFYGCGSENLKNLSLNFDTSNVTNMSNMFSKCGEKNLIELNLGNKFKTNQVINMNDMFKYCGKATLKTLYLGVAFKNIANQKVFKYCGNKKTLVYTSQELQKLLLQQYDFEFEHKNIIPIIDFTEIFTDKITDADGNVKTYDFDETLYEYDFKVYFSDKKILDKTNYQEIGNEIKPAYKGGKHTIYYYIVIPDSFSYRAYPDSGSFTFEIACPHTNTEIRDLKDPTYENEGYTGDTFCMLCDEKIKVGHPSRNSRMLSSI